MGFVYFGDGVLSAAELSAARLDGHLVELGEGYIPADAVETGWMRAASLAPMLGDTLAGSHLTAAWVHGALPEPPSRHTVQRAVPKRLHHVIDRRLQYRDPVIDDADLLAIGGVRVTTPVRTLADLARTPSPVHTAAAAALARIDADLVDAALDWFAARGVMPHKRTAQQLLRRLAGRQDDVTRYTS